MMENLGWPRKTPTDDDIDSLVFHVKTEISFEELNKKKEKKFKSNSIKFIILGRSKKNHIFRVSIFSIVSEIRRRERERKLTLFLGCFASFSKFIWFFSLFFSASFYFLAAAEYNWECEAVVGDNFLLFAAHRINECKILKKMYVCDK